VSVFRAARIPLSLCGEELEEELLEKVWAAQGVRETRE